MDEKNSHLQNDNDSEPEIWNEYQWEEFFRESDKRTDRYLRLLQKYMDHPERDKIVAEKMGWPQMPDGNSDNTELPTDELSAIDFEEGEEWKRRTGYEPAEFDNVENLPLYKKAFEFAIDAISMVNTHLTECKDTSIQSFCRSVTIPSTKIAGGFGLGFEIECLGGNIANCKRGLNAANKMLDALYEIGDKKLIEHNLYLEFHERAKEVRDELAVYIVELRERFRREAP